MADDEKNARKPSAWKCEEELRANIERDVNKRMERHMRRRLRRGDGYHGLIPGAIILAVGVIFLLDNLGYVHARHFLQFWPMIVVFIGAAKMGRRDSRMWGAVILLFGIFLQLNELGVGHFTWGQFWPLLLIAAGGMAMWSAIQARKIVAGRTPEQSSDPRTTLHESAIFGGVEKRFNGREFRGGELQAIFGGVELDLRDADMAEEEAIIYTYAMFGGIELRVPETWFVAARGQGVFGGFNDHTRYVPPNDPDKPKKTLIVAGTALFGGVEIRN